MMTDDESTPFELAVQENAALNAEFPTEADCYEECIRLAHPNRVPLSRCCNSPEMSRPHGGRVGKCNFCKKLTWVLADTAFRKIKRPDVLLLNLRLKSKGIVISMAEFARIRNVAYSSFHNSESKFLKIIAGVMQQAEPHIVHSREFSPVYGKRSSVTPAGLFPQDEQEAMEKHEAAVVVAATQDDETLSENDQNLESSESAEESAEEDVWSRLDTNARAIYDALTEPMSLDQLSLSLNMHIGSVAAGVTFLQLEGLLQDSNNGRLSRVPSPPKLIVDTSATARELISSFKIFIKCTFGAISRKYVQCYLAAFWCARDRTTWTAESLLAVFLQHAEISKQELRAFVSPLFLTIV